jgi:hypothetical protein
MSLARNEAAFTVLRELDDQNAMARKLAEIGSFDVQVTAAVVSTALYDSIAALSLTRRVLAWQWRTDAVELAVGEIVDVQDKGRGVVYAWRVFETESTRDARVEYDILPHSPGSRYGSVSCVAQFSPSGCEHGMRSMVAQLCRPVAPHPSVPGVKVHNAEGKSSHTSMSSWSSGEAWKLMICVAGCMSARASPGSDPLLRWLCRWSPHSIGGAGSAVPRRHPRATFCG